MVRVIFEFDMGVKRPDMHAARLLPYVPRIGDMVWLKVDEEGNREGFRVEYARTSDECPGIVGVHIERVGHDDLYEKDLIRAGWFSSWQDAIRHANLLTE